MIKFSTLSKKLKRDVEYIDTVELGDYKGNTCMCLIAFKSLALVSLDWNKHLIDHINNYLVDCDAILSKTSTSKNIVLLFEVKLL